jgi:hypothetical protein
MITSWFDVIAITVFSWMVGMTLLGVWFIPHFPQTIVVGMSVGLGLIIQRKISINPP